MAELVPLSACATSLTVECLCTNTPLQSNITECVLGSCTLYEGLSKQCSLSYGFWIGRDERLTVSITATKNVTLTMCGAEVRDETSTPLLVGTIGGALALLVFGMRMCSCLPSGSRILGWDDWTIAVTVLLAVPPTVFAVLCKINCIGHTCFH